tara:strand:+ start:140 stop:727 length:588 start_codon:yes stop_codon:yes gene_type:complete
MTKIVTKYFKDNEIDKNITMVGKDAISLQQKIHNLAISTLLVWHDAGTNIKVKHKDKIADIKISAMQIAVERIDNLAGQSTRHTKDFNQWVNRYLPFDWSDEVNGWYCHKDNSVLKGKQFIAARDNPFWTLKPIKTTKAVTCVDDIGRSIEKNAKRRNVAENKRHTDDNLLTYSQECRILDILKENDENVIEQAA